MEISNYLAQIWGISTVVILLALLIKEKHLKRFFSSLDTENNFFLWGVISFVIGLAMVLTYNIWAWNWQVIITILGWASLLKGLLLLFCPETMVNYAKKINNEKWLPIWLMVLLIAGLVITYLGFTAI